MPIVCFGKFISSETHDRGIIFCRRTSRTSKAEEQNSLPEVAGEILDVREEKLCFMLSAYADIPT